MVRRGSRLVFAARDRHCPRLHLLTRRNGDVANAASQPLCAIPEGHAGYAASAAGLYGSRCGEEVVDVAKMGESRHARSALRRNTISFCASNANGRVDRDILVLARIVGMQPALDNVHQAGAGAPVPSAAGRFRGA